MGLLEQLINLDGVSGDEHDVREFIIKQARKYSKNVSVDNIGNVVVHKKGKKPSIVLLAHMDEIGLMVKRIGKRGKMYISPVGGIDPAILLGQRVEIKAKEEIKGVITMDPVLNDQEVGEQVHMDELYIYSGLDAKGLRKKGVKVGTYATFGDSYNCCSLGSDKVISGKALDDRIGCYILLSLLKDYKTDHEMYFVFTVQEEMGLYGAKASMFDIDPDYAIAVDTTGHEGVSDTLVLGNGPSLTMKDAEMIGSRILNDKIQEIAKKLKIPLQLEVSDLGTTDATSVFTAKGGIPSTAFGVSVANIHTTISMAHRDDVEKAIKVLGNFIKNPPKRGWR